jgi:hypothetical protein
MVKSVATAGDNPGQQHSTDNCFAGLQKNANIGVSVFRLLHSL